jgi:hypothetical protein
MNLTPDELKNAKMPLNRNKFSGDRSQIELFMAYFKKKMVYIQLKQNLFYTPPWIMIVDVIFNF